MFYVTHMAACGFYFIALQMGFGPNTWIGAHFGGDVDKVPIFTRYLPAQHTPLAGTLPLLTCMASTAANLKYHSSHNT